MGTAKWQGRLRLSQYGPVCELNKFKDIRNRLGATMLNRIKSIFNSPATSVVIRATTTAIQSGNKQPKLAPMALGGSVIAGAVSMLIGGYKIVDCVRYQTATGQCDSTIEVNLAAVVAGGAAIAGSWGGFNTYNHNLRCEEQPALAQITPKELVVKNPVSVEPSDVLALKEQGLSQREISEVLGISRYAVKKAINLFTNESIS